jgi:hypothetical protein
MGIGGWLTLRLAISMKDRCNPGWRPIPVQQPTFNLPFQLFAKIGSPELATRLHGSERGMNWAVINPQGPGERAPELPAQR